MDNAASNYAETEILNWLTGDSDPPAVSAGRYLALLEDNPSDDDTGTELSGGSYARADLASKFPAATTASNTVSNNATIAFPTATANWNTANYWAIYDASTSGNLITYGWFPSGVTVADTETLTLAIGAISLSVT